MSISGYVKLEWTIGKNEKLISLKLESFCLKLERAYWSWKEMSELESFFLKFEVKFKLFNFINHSPTSVILFNFVLNCRSSIIRITFRTFQLLIFSNCPFQLHVSRHQYSQIVTNITFTAWNVSRELKTNLLIYLHPSPRSKSKLIYFISSIRWSRVCNYGMKFIMKFMNSNYSEFKF